jgi:L-arabinose isomerase
VRRIERGEEGNTMSEILSFEASDHGPYGDLLSERPAVRKKIRVGLLACGYFEYWRMFSPQFKQNVLGDLERIAQRLRRDFEVIYPGVVDTLDAADAAGRVFGKAELDLLIVVEGTYVPDYISLHAIEQAPGVPVLLFTTQVEEDITPQDNYETAMRNSALIGTTQLTGSFLKMGRRFHVVVGSIGEERPYIEIRRWADVQEVARRLRRLNIGVVGHVFRGMYDLENDKTKIKGALGPNVIYVELSHLLKLWKAVGDQNVADEVKALTTRFALRGTSAAEVSKSVKLGLAMRRLVDHLRLDALCFLGQHFIEKEMGAPARLGASLMLEEGKHLVACEGDLAGLTMMHAMWWLTGQSPLQAEWGQYDAAHNALFLVGHGVASFGLASGDAAVTLTGSPEEWGFQGSGVNPEFILKPGPVTMSHLLDTPQGWQMLISGGEALDYPCLPCNEIHALVRVERPVKEYLVEIQKQGVPHHVIVVHGDIRQELRALAELLGIRAFDV